MLDVLSVIGATAVTALTVAPLHFSKAPSLTIAENRLKKAIEQSEKEGIVVNQKYSTQTIPYKRLQKRAERKLAKKYDRQAQFLERNVPPARTYIKWKQLQK